MEKTSEVATDNRDITQKSFECAMQELESLVKGIEQGKLSLAVLVKDYERAWLLKAHCENLLESATRVIEAIIPTEKK